MPTNDQLAHLAPLRNFAGSWRTTGVFRPESGTHGTFTATDDYQWLDGGFFLVHRWRANMPAGVNSGIEIIGYDPSTGGFTMHSFDNEGNAGTMTAHLQGETWVFEGPTLRFHVASKKAARC